MPDETTTLAELRDLVRRFVDQRDWSQFHNPKNLSMSIAIEAAELMEHFQWLNPEATGSVRDDADTMQQVREELADVFCYALAFSNALDIDLSGALVDKLRMNEQKYPADKFRGRFR